MLRSNVFKQSELGNIKRTGERMRCVGTDRVSKREDQID